MIKNILFLAIVIIMTSCDLYKSEVSISSEIDSTVSDEFLGKWIFCEKDKRGYVLPVCELNILNWGNGENLVLCTFYENYGKKVDIPTPIKTWVSIVGNKKYVNAKVFGDKENGYNFYKYRAGDANTLEINYLTDSLKVQFDNSSSFYDYILNNQTTFESYFNGDWLPYQRWNSLNWQIVNQHWLGQIEDLIKLNKNVSIEDFENKSIPELIKFSEETTEEERAILDAFNDFHLVSNGDISWKEKPQKFLIRKANGEYVKIMIGRNWMVDVGENYVYHKNNDKTW